VETGRRGWTTLGAAKREIDEYAVIINKFLSAGVAELHLNN